VWVGSTYGTTAKATVGALKYRCQRSAADPIARQLDAVVPYLDTSWLIVPVPTIAMHIRGRGFDHTLLIARRLARLRAVECVQVLQRNGSLKQVGASRALRTTQLAGAFEYRDHSIDVNRPILLVDDVYTTGATIAEAARELRTHGHRHVYGAVFAQKTT
jgi:ComF family protein